MNSSSTIAPLSGTDSDVEKATPADSRRSGMLLIAGIVLLLVVIGPTLWGAVSSMGWPQWLEAVAIGLVFFPAAMGVFVTFRVLDFPDLTVDASFPAG